MTKQITRTVLVGKNRRITLDELYLLSKREARLEVVVVQPAAEESPHLTTTTTTTTTTTSSSSSSTRRSSIEAALERLSLEEDDDDDDDAQSSSPPPPPMPLLSEGATIASLALLSLTLAQGRIAVAVRDDGGDGGGGDPGGAPMLSAAIADLVDGGGGGSSSSPLRLPVDPAAYAKVVDGLLAPPARSGEDGDGVCDGGGGGGSQTLPRLVDGPYLSRSISIARVSLMMARARSLTSKSVCDAISCLTVERLGEHLSLDLYSAVNYDELRPHRGCVESAAVLRACLQGSTRVACAAAAGGKKARKGVATTTTTTEVEEEEEEGKNNGAASSRWRNGGTDAAAAARYASTIPQYHGPARESILSACRTMELELNCSPTSAIEELDDTVASLAVVSTLTGILALSHGIGMRTGGVGVGGGGGATTAAKKTAATGGGGDPPSPWGLSGLASELEGCVDGLQSSLEREARMGCDHISSELSRREGEHKAREAERAAKRTGAVAGGPNLNNGPNDDANGGGGRNEFAGMTEAQKAKILKKRAEKEAKAAAKLKAKEDKASGGQAALSSIFGAGTSLIYPLLSSSPSSSSYPGNDAADAFSGLLSDATLLSELEKTVDGLLSGGMQRKPKVPKGTRDYLPEQMSIRDEAFTIIRRVFKRHGAVEIDTPVFELKETLTGKYGEDSKLIYDLADQGGESLALRYDLTVPFARFLAVNAVGNIKRYHIGKVYRRDQPALSKGRYREFYQCDFDIAGTYGRMAPDSECLAVACEILDALPIGNFGIKVNHRRLLDAILDICGVPADKFRSICSAVDKLDKEPWSEVRREMVDEKGLAGDVADRIGEFVVLKGEPWDMYNSLMDGKKFGDHKGALEAMEDLRICFDYLDAMDKLRFVSFDLSLARGLDYYTGVIYEAVCMNGNTQVGSIGGGGRYDNLVSMFQEAGKVTPCVGVSIGIERVFTLMEERLRQEQGGSIKQPNVAVLVASAGENLLRERMKLAKVLWDANISAEFNQQENPKLKFEIANALDRQIPFMVIAGEEEAREGKCKVKDLRARTEETVDLSELVKTLRGKGVVPVGCEFAMELLHGESG